MFLSSNSNKESRSDVCFRFSFAFLVETAIAVHFALYLCFIAHLLLREQASRGRPHFSSDCLHLFFQWRMVRSPVRSKGNVVAQLYFAQLSEALIHQSIVHRRFPVHMSMVRPFQKTRHLTSTLDLARVAALCSAPISFQLVYVRMRC